MARVKARILTDTRIDGVDYKVNQLVVLDDKQAELLEESGVLDTSKGAVDYCIDELDAKPIEHKPKEEAAAPSEKAAAKKGKK